jgi:hypothetical protein
VLLRRLLVAAAAGGTAFLMLAVTGHALRHTDRPGAELLRLAWCAVPLALTAHLAVLTARTEPGGRLRAGLSDAGLGDRGLALLAAAGAALNCAFGAVLGLLAFLHLRGDLAGGPLGGAAADLLGGGHPVPAGAALTLLALPPAAAAAATAVSLRPGRAANRPDAQGADNPVAAPPPDGLPWGVAAIGTGLALILALTTGGVRPLTPRLALPGGLGHTSPGVLAGWLLLAAGTVIAAPGLLHGCGRLVALHRPGALRLLAGRALQEEARRVGRPLGALCAVTAALAAAPAARPHHPGPLTLLGAAISLVCAVAAVGVAMLEARQARRPATEALTRLGAPASLLRGAFALRAGVALAAAVPLTVALAALGSLPRG